MKTMRDELEEQMEKQKSIQKEVMERERELHIHYVRRIYA